MSTWQLIWIAVAYLTMGWLMCMSAAYNNQQETGATPLRWYHYSIMLLLWPLVFIMIQVLRRRRDS